MKISFLKQEFCAFRFLMNSKTSILLTKIISQVIPKPDFNF